MQAKKSLGQHWLNDRAALEAMCNAANVQKDDTVLEVGPGQGSLTKVLLDRDARVVAVELDKSLAEALEKKFSGLPFTLNMLSILDFDLSTLPKDYKLVANIPYYLTAHLLRMLSETQHKPSIAALLVQKEVAERISAKPGQLSVLALFVQFYYDVRLGRTVSAKLFSPPPKVDSQIIVLRQYLRPVFPGYDPGNEDVKGLFRLIQAGFGERRKKLRSSLSGGLHISKQSAEELLNKADIDPNRRAQELSIDEWHSLYEKFQKY